MLINWMQLWQGIRFCDLDPFLSFIFKFSTLCTYNYNIQSYVKIVYSVNVLFIECKTDVARLNNLKCIRILYIIWTIFYSERKAIRARTILNQATTHRTVSLIKRIYQHCISKNICCVLIVLDYILYISLYIF